MNSFPAHRGGRHVAAPTPHAPNAALLIDFDNVTLGVRSDLTKELRSLLNSEIIKGKVAVQRAYADWRRYPQYIVPLSESSIDLIFAPAFGTNKKNATDIRLAVDAIELVFTRPEIGTFILLSGDSDFSSMVLKLKEYGKYVIGVGIRESASDILIQNCDEYFSYSDLAGLSKEPDTPSAPRDPWVLVVEAVARMATNNDVMRSDRLKQVMQQMDPSFDERNAGYNRFSKFVTEAGTRKLIKVIKQENGQFDVAPLSSTAPTATASPTATAPRGAARGTSADTAEKDGAERSGRRRRGGRGRGRGKPGEESAAPSAPALLHLEHEQATGLTLAEAFHLLARALGELPAPVPHETLRARMAVMYGKEDPLLEPGRFAMLLRQANDAEVADVRMLSDDKFEVSPHKTDLNFQRRAPVEPTATGEAPVAPVARAPAGLRFRGGSRTAARPSGLHMVGVVDLGGAVAPAATTVIAPVVAEAASSNGTPAATETAAKPAGRAPRAKASPKASPKVAKSAAPKAPKEKKASPRPTRTSKPRAG